MIILDQTVKLRQLIKYLEKCNQTSSVAALDMKLTGPEAKILSPDVLYTSYGLSGIVVPWLGTSGSLTLIPERTGAENQVRYVLAALTSCLGREMTREGKVVGFKPDLSTPVYIDSPNEVTDHAIIGGYETKDSVFLIVKRNRCLSPNGNPWMTYAEQTKLTRAEEIHATIRALNSELSELFANDKKDDDIEDDVIEDLI